MTCCTASVYRSYQQNDYQGHIPTLQDFRAELLQQDEPEAKELALAIELFTHGSLNTFAKQTNVDTNNRLICYDILDLGKENVIIIHQLLEEYDIQSAEDIQDVLKDLLGGTIKEMMEAEMDDHLGYEKSERSDSDDYRNGYKRKRVNSCYGSIEIEVPQDRKINF